MIFRFSFFLTPCCVILRLFIFTRLRQAIVELEENEEELMQEIHHISEKSKEWKLRHEETCRNHEKLEKDHNAQLERSQQAEDQKKAMAQQIENLTNTCDQLKL